MISKKLIFAALVAALTLSCSNDNAGSDGKDTGDGKIVPVDFSIVIDETLGRASFPTPNANSKEKTITNVALFIFNNQRKLEVMKTADYVRENGSTHATVNFSMELPVGRHYAYAVANVPKSYLSYAAEGMTIEEFSEEILEYDLEVLTGKSFFDNDGNLEEQLKGESRGFFMTTQGGFYEFWAIDTEGVTDSNANKPRLLLERIVAKVSVAFDPEDQKNGTLSNVEYIVTNNPSRVYAVPQYSGTALLTPNYDLTWVDPTYFQEPLDDYKPAIIGQADEDADFTYCMENSNSTPREGNATMVMIKAVFTPYDYLDDMGNVLISTPSSKDFYMTYTTKDGITLPDAGKYYAVTPDNSLVAANQKVVYFKDGICYYPVWLKNINSGNESQYTVKRNSYYMLTINSVSGAGEPGPGNIIDPEVPLDRSVNIDVLINVANWNPIEDNQGIGR